MQLAMLRSGCVDSDQGQARALLAFDERAVMAAGWPLLWPRRTRQGSPVLLRFRDEVLRPVGPLASVRFPRRPLRREAGWLLRVAAARRAASEVTAG